MVPFRPNVANKTVLAAPIEEAKPLAPTPVLPIQTLPPVQASPAPFHCYFCRRPLYAHEVRRKEVKVGQSRANFFETRSGNQNHYAMVDVCEKCGVEEEDNDWSLLIGIFVVFAIFLGLIVIIIGVTRS